MVLARSKEFWTVEEYLELEKKSPVKHEYVDGQIYAMSGASKNHNRIAGNLLIDFNQQLSEGKCEVFIGEIKVRVRPTLYYYPDLIVVCDPLSGVESEDEYIADSPTLIVEVLSKSTARTDRTEKMNEYQKLISLREYVLVSQDQIKVEVYRHSYAGEPWQKEIYTEPTQEAFFESIDLKIKLAEIYRRVQFSAISEETEEDLERQIRQK